MHLEFKEKIKRKEIGVGETGKKTAIRLPPCKSKKNDERCGIVVMGGCMSPYPYEPLKRFQRRKKIRIASSRVIRKYAHGKTGRLSGLRIILLTAPSRCPSGLKAVFVPSYSNGWFAMALHHLSF